MRLVNREDRRYPCGHSIAQFGDGEPTLPIPRRCNQCGQRYLVTFEPASDHVQELTGAVIWRTKWEAV